MRQSLSERRKNLPAAIRFFFYQWRHQKNSGLSLKKTTTHFSVETIVFVLPASTILEASA
jgi:hypothetical protein